MAMPVSEQFSGEQKELVRALYEDGCTQTEIAEKLGVARRTIGKLCKHMNLSRSASEAGSLKMKSNLDTDEKVSIIRSMRQNSASLADIADAVGGTTSSVHRICTKYKIPLPGTDYSEVAKKYESGMSTTELAKEYGIAQQTILAKLHKRQVVMRPPRLKYDGNQHSGPRITAQQAIEAYGQLGSLSAVAEKHNYSLEGIKKILIKNGIAIRNTNEMFAGDGNPFFGKKHPDDVVQKCREVGTIAGQKFWDDHPEYVEVVRQKQKEYWTDARRQEVSKRVAQLRAEGKCHAKRSLVETRFGSITVDSSYEFKFIEFCEQDKRIVHIEYEFDMIEYEFGGQSRIYLPDFRVWFDNGEFLIVETKSDWYARQDKEREKIIAGFGAFRDKFMILSDDFTIFSDRVANLYNPIEFEFNDLILNTIQPSEYMPFYSCFHYMGKTGRKGYTVGAYLNDKLIACATISSITRNEMAKKFNMEPSQVRELVRFCIHPDHHKKNMGSWLLSKVIKMYKADNPDVGLLISFADNTVGHTGTIYKAAGWIYDGATSPSYHYNDSNGNIIHKKTVWDKAISVGVSEKEYAAANSLIRIKERPKYRYYIKI